MTDETTLAVMRALATASEKAVADISRLRGSDVSRKLGRLFEAETDMREALELWKVYEGMLELEAIDATTT